MEYLLVLMAALFHASWNLLLKRSEQGQLTFTLIRFVGAVFGLSILVFYRHQIDSAAIPYLVAAAIFHFIYFYALLNAYKLGDLSQVYPISRGVAPLLVLVASLLMGYDDLSQGQILACMLICIGILSLAFGQGRISSKAIAFSLLTSVCIAGYTLSSGLGVRVAGDFLVYAGWLELTIGTSLLLFSLLSGKLQRASLNTNTFVTGIGAGILSVSAYLVVLWAMSINAMGPIAALRETSIIFAALLGAVFLSENFGLKRILSAVCVACGVVLLSVF